MPKLLSFTLKDKKTPLHKAAENGQYDVCETLLECDANVYKVDDVSITKIYITHKLDVEINSLFDTLHAERTNATSSSC